MSLHQTDVKMPSNTSEFEQQGQQEQQGCPQNKRLSGGTPQALNVFHVFPDHFHPGRTQSYPAKSSQQQQQLPKGTFSLDLN